MQPIDIVYRHKDFIVIDKPCGMSVHKDDQDIGLTTLVADRLSLPQVWLVHRLDKVTSGLLILALNENAAAYLSQLFAQHSIQKTYLALSVHKPKKKQGLIVGDMEKARRGAWKLCPTKQNPAITRFHSVSCEPNLRLFVLKPQTGKTHQLRVAMKNLGSPILGDELYGGNAEKSDRTYLHAYQLTFQYQNEPISLRVMPKCGEFFQRNSVIQGILSV
ncbi:TIGR01621 family pseudouridine synthase [Caviibacterium pharyngocola]|uniref:TIGR01621 family pseudouridine synthase n=1 Tax=Caviibacterium pharyngocola TaxID=28159 RepID=A0A2M8RYW2_9PAST|nr:TIGR01621 family pseudouridine synthase [Caviibacterium pharyngocola]PJG84087.1 TIGR01621 family pseudouridine synthase [Caviibacterium pharyngocola]